VARAGAIGGGLAFLSACETAVGDAALADESLTLAGAFQAAGYRHVIATQWTVSDRVMWQLVRDFYRNLPREAPEGAARALHQAVLRTRQHHAEHPAAWAQFVHVGP
jgi:CHAT domain-containing protein